MTAWTYKLSCRSLTFNVQIYIHTPKQWIHKNRTNVGSFTFHLDEGEGKGGISSCEGLQPNTRALGLLGATAVAEKFGPLSVELPVPLHGDVRSSMVNAKLTVELFLRSQAGFH